MKVDDLAIENAEDALTFLRAVYQHPKVPLPVRMRAASMAIPYERPALKAHALVVAEGDFAQRLEAAIARSGLAPKLIDAEPVELPPAGPEPTPMAAPFASRRRA
jgi:hypothetical protein